MLEKFKSLPSKRKCVVGIIAALIFPVTIMLMSAELAINGFKEGKIVKLLGGITILLATCIFLTSGSDVYSSLYNEQTEELNKAKSQLSDVKEQLNDTKIKLEEKENITEELKIYLGLNDDEKNKVSEFINEMKTSKEDVNENKNETTVEATNIEEDKPIEVKNNTNVEAAESNNKHSENIENNLQKEEQVPNVSIENTVYANGGSSKSNKYHSSPTAHNMEGAIKMSESEAQSSGYVACKKCY